MTSERPEDIAGSFIGWQCRLRQHVVRRSDGRPGPGMCPAVTLADGPLGTIVTALVKADSEEAIAQFRHIVKQTHDPLQRYEAAVRILQTVYYQYPREFSDELTALFGPGTGNAAKLLTAGRCTLDYRQANQRYIVPCLVRSLPAEDPCYQATYWHNAMFNPKLAGPATVLQFAPDWPKALAETS